jgi:prevent-host-death family protein
MGSGSGAGLARLKPKRVDMDYSLVQMCDTFFVGCLRMQVSVTDAKGQLTDLVRRAEAGEEVILTRHGYPAVRLVAVKTVPDRAARRRILEEIRASGAAKASPGPSAARSQDFLYDEDGLPG